MKVMTIGLHLLNDHKLIGMPGEPDNGPALPAGTDHARQLTKSMLMEETKWFDASEIRADWQRRGQIFGIAGPEEKDLYPAYQSNADRQPLPVIGSVLEVFGPDVDLWILAAWFHFPNGWLVRGDDAERRPVAPKDLLDDAAAVIEAAKMHGKSYVA